MKILYLAHRVPYPPNKGEKIRSYHHLRHLAAAYEVHLVSLYDQPEDAHWAPALGELCRTVTLVRLDRKRALLRAALALAGGRSLSQGYFAEPGLVGALRDVAPGTVFDVAWSSTSALPPSLAEKRARRRVCDFVDVDSEKWRELAAHTRPPLGWLYHLEALRLRAAEISAAGAADRVLFVSDEEASLFHSFAPRSLRTQVVANGVDSDYFHPPTGRLRSSVPTVLFTGTLEYAPNVDAVVFLIGEVMPLVRRAVPAARLTAVGHRPASRLLSAARRAGDAVTIAGSVPDVRPFLHAADLYAAPIRFGRGVKNKVLEAMAAGVPLVASGAAVAGLEAKAGEHFLPAESAAEFADALVTLWRQPDRARALAKNALAYVRDRHRWEACLRSIDACLEEGVRDGIQRPLGGQV